MLSGGGGILAQREKAYKIYRGRHIKRRHTKIKMMFKVETWKFAPGPNCKVVKRQTRLSKTHCSHPANVVLKCASEEGRVVTSLSGPIWLCGKTYFFDESISWIDEMGRAGTHHGVLRNVPYFPLGLSP